MDPFSILGIPPTASQDEIKKAYRGLALQYHPDRNSHPRASEKFKQVSEAYALIGDPESRKAYEAQRSRSNSAGFKDIFGSQGARGYSSSWEDMFGSSFKSRPYIIKAKVFFTLEELNKAVKKTFTFDSQKIEFRTPVGSRPGDVLTLQLNGGQELHLTIGLEEHEIFELRKDDLYSRVVVPIDIALKGGEVSVPTLEDRVSLKIPPRTSSHTKLRLKSVGLPKKTGGSGSIIYEVKLDLKKISPELLSWSSVFS